LRFTALLAWPSFREMTLTGCLGRRDPAGGAMQSTFPLGLGILAVVVLLAALAATGYFIGREYVNGRWNRRDWN
jgi:hypothetical protein